MSREKQGNWQKRLKPRYILSYGGGVNTTALMVYLIQNNAPLDEAVFADTGSELPETYQNVRMAESYLKKFYIPFRTVKSNTGTLYETCKRRRVIPSKIWRWSTRDYKITPIHRHYRSLNCHINEYLGISFDEIERVKPNREPYITSIFPLVDNRITRDDCIRIIKEAGLKVPIKSGCFFCPFHSLEEWRWIYENHHDLYIKAMHLEEDSKHFPDQRLNKVTLRVLKDEHFNNGSRSAPTLSDNPCEAYCMT
ncbi:MAG: phosphoadenosine phosphosulfate reductase family protein [Nitrososphaerales archaeon]